ncbi:leucine-rich repeat-containing protein 23 isoform X2 [Crotalus tigris]|uniref:leucine-rich repeat-containing protein 23 isoform X2 n=1 Tax=Crotalus tigris TaxID=88082 RepID=UPI00192FADB4|nr:leucine-rich repeat-containing protein 23 isoform X2 [Crotalus tigris]
MSDEEPDDENDTEEEVEEKKEEREVEVEVEGEGEGAVEEEEPQVSTSLNEEMVKEGLSLLCKTGNGLAHAFVKLEVREKHLLWLKVDNNRLISASIEELPYLQIASFANNHIKDCDGICHPRLVSLNLRSNAIEVLSGLNPNILSNLHTVELRGNSLKSTAGIYLPKLKNLYLGQNAISHLEDLENLEQLTTLHLRDNLIEVLEGFSSNMKSLQYLNLRGNAVAQVQELEKLQVLPMLRALVLLENPCSDEAEYRLEALVLLPHLERLDKDFFEEEERNEAAEIRQRRKEEELELQKEREREKELEEAEDTTQEDLTTE